MDEANCTQIQVYAVTDYFFSCRFGGSYAVKVRVSGHSVNQEAVINFVTSLFQGAYLKVRRHLSSRIFFFFRILFLIIENIQSIFKAS